MTGRRPSPALLAAASVCLAVCGCVPGDPDLRAIETVWGQRGLGPGKLQKPRAIAIDQDDRVYLVDMTARVQVFDRDGQFLHGWQTPQSTNGRPSGLTASRDGKALLVADTHYYQMLVYGLDGELQNERTIGGAQGRGEGEFGFVTDAVQDSAGNYYVGEYGDYDRIQKFAPDGAFLLQWGGHGSEPGQFRRPQNLLVDGQDRIWVADACNHRIQVFSTDGELLFHWGEEGSAPGQLYYPYDLDFDPDGNLVVCEYGNHRVQKFTVDGESLACWGAEGRQPGQLHNPWALAIDSQGSVHVVDSNNHRVQRIQL